MQSQVLVLNNNATIFFKWGRDDIWSLKLIILKAIDTLGKMQMLKVRHICF